MVAQFQVKGWSEMSQPPSLTDRQWGITSLLAAILVVMAVLQAIGFGDFKDWLDSVGLGAPATWAIVIIVAELWAAIGFFKLPLMNGFRMISTWLAILVSGFWFIENLRLVSEGRAGILANSGFFGKYLTQSPGWWTVIEVTVLVLWAVYSVKLTWSKS